MQTHYFSLSLVTSFLLQAIHIIKLCLGAHPLNQTNLQYLYDLDLMASFVEALV